MQDLDFMNEAIKLALKGSVYTHPNPRVGCVITKDNTIIGKGYHKSFGSNHAEVNAVKYCLNKFGKNKGVDLLRGSTAYITLEPCSIFSKTPPCTDTILKYEIKNIFCASLDPNPAINGKGVRVLRKAGLNVKVGLLKKEAVKINEEFFFRHNKGRPFVRMKVAQSIDGKIALANGDSKWISSKESRSDVQNLRAEVDAILVGSGTVLKDNPRLNVRNSNKYKAINRQPKKIILGKIDYSTLSGLKLFKEDSENIIFSNDDFVSNHSKVIFKKLKKQNSLKQLLKELTKYEINSLLIEGGSQVFTSFIEENIVDELIVYLSPKILGNSSKNATEVISPKTLNNAKNFKILKSMTVGDDIKIIMRRK